MTHPRLLFAILLTAYLCAVAVCADEASSPKGLQVLSTGNSFHFYVPRMLQKMARAAGKRLLAIESHHRKKR